MGVVAALATVAAGLLAVAGLAKLRAPATLARALRIGGQRGSRVLAVAVGVAEVAIAGTALVLGGALAFGLLALAYAAVTLVAARQWRRGGDCGCFGGAGAAAPTPGLHVLLDAVATVVAALAALLAAPGLVPLVADTPLAGAPAVGALVLAVVLTREAFVRLPDLWAAQALHGGGTA